MAQFWNDTSRSLSSMRLDALRALALPRLVALDLPAPGARPRLSPSATFCGSGNFWSNAARSADEASAAVIVDRLQQGPALGPVACLGEVDRRDGDRPCRHSTSRRRTCRSRSRIVKTTGLLLFCIAASSLATRLGGFSAAVFTRLRSLAEDLQSIGLRWRRLRRRRFLRVGARRRGVATMPMRRAGCRVAWRTMPARAGAATAPEGAWLGLPAGLRSLVAGFVWRLRRPRRAAAGRLPLPGRQQAGLGVDPQLVARVGDVEVAHRQLADAVLRREASTRPFPSSAARACR